MGKLMIGDQVVRGGRVVAFKCGYGHTDHTSKKEAEDCEPDVYKKVADAKKDEAEKTRLATIQDHPLFNKAVSAVRDMGGATKEDCEAVVLVHGVDKVLAASKAIDDLKIPEPKPKPVEAKPAAGDQKDPGPAAPGNPAPPAGGAPAK